MTTLCCARSELNQFLSFRSELNQAVQHNCHRKERATSKVKVDQALEPFPLSFDDAEKLVMDLPMEGIYTTGWNVKPLVFPAEVNVTVKPAIP